MDQQPVRVFRAGAGAAGRRALLLGAERAQAGRAKEDLRRGARPSAEAERERGRGGGRVQQLQPVGASGPPRHRPGQAHAPAQEAGRWHDHVS